MFFTATFDQFNTSFLNNLLQRATDPKHLNSFYFKLELQEYWYEWKYDVNEINYLWNTKKIFWEIGFPVCLTQHIGLA